MNAADLTHEDGREPVAILRMPVDMDVFIGVQRLLGKAITGLNAASVTDVLIQRGDWLCLYEPPVPTPEVET